jgi:cation diffusion facilitator CzcD-associated flavoprotein CzcO
MTTSGPADAVVVGAGPYGLSIAAHLRARGLGHRAFGSPMQTWLTAMPEGMLLKSDGFASSLSAPLPGATLAEYCADQDLPYHPTHIPVPLETFAQYGLDFQRRFVPHLESPTVAAISQRAHGFRVALADGEEFEARCVVVAVGITHFASTPPVFAGLPSSLASHSSDHRDLIRFAGRDVTVVGAGASAVELAVGLANAGAKPRMIVRAGTVKFASPPPSRPRSLFARIRHPSSGLGPGVRSRLCCDAPDLFRLLPGGTRGKLVRRHLGPSSAWHLRTAFEASVDLLTSHRIVAVEPHDGRLRIDTANGDGNATVETDHVICATGYRADLRRLTFLDDGLRDRIQAVNDAPSLSRSFESSVKGLFFAGLAGAMTFGPLMRFVYGAEFTAQRITSRIAAGVA